MNADGFEVNARGEPFPLTQMAHACEGLTYDTELRRFMAMRCPNTDYLHKYLKARRAVWLEGKTLNRSTASPGLSPQTRAAMTILQSSPASEAGFEGPRH